ncbi:ATP-binding cassette domain-containing protein [Xanthobacter autotrophicus]|uniref:ATP-binding cassette domain-containing protein n=1 Tax=Xanthobacter autotrophicus TaxID=280 RepID=UPI00372D03D8
MALSGASYAFPARVDVPPFVLGPADFEICAGELLFIVGANGSGKTTLLKLLAGQLPPSHGHVRLAGTPLARWGARAFGLKVVYLPQQPPPAAGLQVRELLALGRYTWHGALGRFRVSDREKVAEALALTGMEPFADRLVDTLSGGERQRAFLAMLVAQDAECRLLDEPISALDIAHQVEVLSLVQRLAVEPGMGVVIVLHDVNMAARFCDEVIALPAGRLIARGTPAEMMAPAALEAIYGIAMEVMPHPSHGTPVAFAR